MIQKNRGKYNGFLGFQFDIKSKKSPKVEGWSYHFRVYITTGSAANGRNETFSLHMMGEMSWSKIELTFCWKVNVLIGVFSTRSYGIRIRSAWSKFLLYTKLLYTFRLSIKLKFR